jgi:uncharacterized membrane protein
MIDAIAEAERISVSSKQFKAIVGKGNSVKSLLIYMCISLILTLIFAISTLVSIYLSICVST